MTRQFKRILEAAAVLLTLVNTAYFAASWERSHMPFLLVSLLVITVIAVVIVRCIPITMRDEVRREFARQRVLNGVENTTTSSTELGDDDPSS
ncbi:hypothetical protein [Glycomyces sp. NPDC048151]|uniref:hypothetical protein n=1 Tax=Glycomyces sp. NPDC048151 TaxID=3364002 RepID=UPI003714B941